MFKDLFVKLLQERYITAYKLSNDTGISEGLISQWKSGRQLPKYDSLKILCDYFDVSADYLLERGTSSVTAVNNSVAAGGNIDAPVTIKNGHERVLTAQEKDLLRIYNEADGKTQMRIMQFVYELDEEK